MGEPKTYASLSSGLLARKGGAKPAMRPQAMTSFSGNVEDLGWNDMGHQLEPFDHVPSSIAALTPAPNGRGHVESAAPEPVEIETEAAFELEPPVVAQQRALEESFPAPETEEAIASEGPAEAPVRAPAAPADIVHLPKRKAVPAAGPAKTKAAFTLRLDPERHLRLRLACAVKGRSAQQLVTAALDDFLAGLPEVEELAGRLPAGQTGR